MSSPISKSIERMIGTKLDAPKQSSDTHNTYTNIMIGTEAFNNESVQNDARTIVQAPEREWLDFANYNANYPYCPVFADKKEDGSIHYSAYLHGGIINIAEYQNYILTLMGAKENDVVHTYIDSPGGDLLTGAAIASAIEMSRAKTVGDACGLCASAGSLDWTANDELKVSDFGTVMYHMSSHIDMGNSVRIEENAANLKTYVAEKCLKIALKKGILTQEEVDSILTKYREVWLGASVVKKRINPTPIEDTNHDEPTVESQVIKDDESLEEVHPGTEALEFNLKSLLARSQEIAPVYTAEGGNHIGLDTPSEFKIGLESAQTPTSYYSAIELNKMTSEDACKAAYVQNLYPMSNSNNVKSDPREMFSIIQVGSNSYQIFLDYMKNYWDPKFSTAFARSLDKMTEQDQITIILPGGICLWSIHHFGALLSAMQRCRGTITTIIAGPAEFADIVIWLYGKNRILGNYGKLRLNAEIMTWRDFVTYRKEYIEAILNRAIEISLITQEQKDAFINDNQSIIIHAKESED
jgi:ATP-dependent protease ClpP protease subunit